MVCCDLKAVAFIRLGFGASGGIGTTLGAG
jgi:hypothetical protein